MPAQAWITLVAGVLAVVGVVLTVRQRTRADNRAQSWQRITWCLERTVSENDEEAALGWRLFGTVARTPFIATTDRRTLQAISQHAARNGLAETADEGDNEDDTELEGCR